ncbi:hypothetical protein TWF718_010965 [Orbilia javanica]|uniref:Uncharacterized protein n=1 Tax=Orbilia javanica TaxID=47235 RepID=A0AAN8MN59_9PEZI
MHFKALYVTILFTTTQAQWSYRLLYTPVSREVILWTTMPVIQYPKPCAGLSRRYTPRNARNPGPASKDSIQQALSGISIHQPKATDNNGNPILAKYIGFWTSYNCKSLPKYVVHFKPALQTIQEVTFQSFDNFIPGFNISDFNVWGWGEIPLGDKIFEHLPVGAAAFRESGTHSWTGNYIIVEDMVASGPRTPMHGRLQPNPRPRPEHWHIDIGEANQQSLTRPKDGSIKPLVGDVVSYRYYGPLAPEYVRLYEGRDSLENLRVLDNDQGEGNMMRMEEELRLPLYNMDEQKRAILKAYMQIHGAESALYTLQQMIDEYRFRHYMSLLTPELRDAVKRDGIMQLQVGERADKIAEARIQREALQLPEESRAAFVATNREQVQRERDTGREMILFLINEMQSLDTNPNEGQLGDDRREETTETLVKGGEQQEIGLGVPGIESIDNGGRNNGMAFEAESMAQLLPESNSFPPLDFRPVAGSEIQRLAEQLLNENNPATVNLDIEAQGEPQTGEEELTIEYTKPEEDVRENIFEEELEIAPGNGFIDPELRSVIDSEVERLVQSDYGELLRLGGQDANEEDEQDFEESPQPDVSIDEPIDQIPSNQISIAEVPVNLASNPAQNQASEELDDQNPVGLQVNIASQAENGIIIPEQDQPLEWQPNNQPPIESNQIEIESDDEPRGRFASTFGRARNSNEARPDDSPGTVRHTTTHGRMSFRDWMASRTDQAASELLDLGIVPNVAEDHGS